MRRHRTRYWMDERFLAAIALATLKVVQYMQEKKKNEPEDVECEVIESKLLTPND